jgi:flavin reductase (DIM6/NTAB) family NADH-FMN oxidoreductase RutF
VISAPWTAASQNGQQVLAKRFARKGDDKFADVTWSMNHDLPRIHGAGSWIACRLEDLLDGGDHEIVVGLVHHAEQEARQPLLYQQGTFMTVYRTGSRTTSSVAPRAPAARAS